MKTLIIELLEKIIQFLPVSAGHYLQKVKLSDDISGVIVIAIIFFLLIIYIADFVRNKVKKKK